MDDDLNLDRSGWSMGEAAFRTAVALLADQPPRTIVEFGSGPSSVRLALAFPEAAVLSIEHDRHHWLATTDLSRRLAPHSNITVVHRRIAWQRHFGAWYQSYETGHSFPATIDAVIIDGPPMACLGGREACLYQVAPHLRIGAVVILDDYCRPEEQQAVRNWHKVYSGCLSSHEYAVGHGLLVTRLVGPPQGRAVLSVLWMTHLRLFRRVLHRLRRAATANHP
jgi:predicted O-methyltransferase YrrM